jgi:hypothetical protein
VEQKINELSRHIPYCFLRFFTSEEEPVLTEIYPIMCFPDCHHRKAGLDIK